MERLAQLNNGGEISEEIGMCLKQAWKKVEKDNGGFGSDKKDHLLLGEHLTRLRLMSHVSV
jgi:hypothetical protein